jgi:hypothetical protein
MLWILYGVFFLIFCVKVSFLYWSYLFALYSRRVEHCVLLYCAKVYFVVYLYTLSVVTCLWACVNVYYDVEHLVLIMAVLIDQLGPKHVKDTKKLKYKFY